MRRREFIAGASGVAAALNFARSALAQTGARQPGIKRISFVHPSEKIEEMTINGRRTFKAYFGELQRLGYVEGQNLIVERHSGLGRPDRYGELTRAIVASQPDLIVSMGTPLALQFKPLTSTIPILAATADPLPVGLVTNLARPNANITGVSVDAGLEVWGKRFQLLSETVRSHLTNIRYLRGTIPALLDVTWVALRQAAERAGTPIGDVFIDKFDQAAYVQLFETMQKDRVDGLIVSDAAEHITYRALIVQLAAQHRLPAIYSYREYVDVGGLLAYGIDFVDVMRRLADMTDEVLRGAKPTDLPFYQQTKFELVLNRITARSLGLEFPTSLLTVADEVIE